MLNHQPSPNPGTLTVPTDAPYTLPLPVHPIVALKTGMALPERVHPYWHGAIENSSAINWCVRRDCHEFVEGFPEAALYRQTGCEDIAYYCWLSRFFILHRVRRATVAYLRRPGNHLDRQLVKFRTPPEQFREQLTPEERHLHGLRARLEKDRLVYLLEKFRLAQPSPFPIACLNWKWLTSEFLTHNWHPEAVALYEQARAFDPAGAAALHPQVAPAYRQLRRDPPAVPAATRDAAARALNQEGVALARRGKAADAADRFRRAVHLQPDYAVAHNNLGNAYFDLGKLPEALVCFQKALRLDPAYALAHGNLGNLLFHQGQLDEAVASYRQALFLKPDFVEAHSNLGLVFLKQDRWKQAAASFRDALSHKPDFAEAHNHLARTLIDQEQLPEAVAHYQEALRHNPNLVEAHWGLSLTWLTLGNLEQGWVEYEWRWRREGAPRRTFPQPHWDGSPLAGRAILLHAEQGLGDALQFIRYAALVKQRGGSVVVECPGPLLPLLTRCPGIDRLVAQGSQLPPFDVQSPLMSLPRLFGTTLATIPAPIPYLFPDAERVDYWRQRFAGVPGFKVGIAWQGNPRHRRDRFRSVALAHFEPLSRVQGVRLYSLQVGAGCEQLAALSGRFVVEDLGGQLDESRGPFLDLTGILKNLDLVVTVDTALAHLAGGLGVPVWVVLSTLADWRWLRERTDNPWYPSMRLFRQPTVGDWNGVFNLVADALAHRSLPPDNPNVQIQQAKQIAD
jgi:tetratricopeptide (TPR) repeat protein